MEGTTYWALLMLLGRRRVDSCEERRLSSSKAALLLQLLLLTILPNGATAVEDVSWPSFFELPLRQGYAEELDVNTIPSAQASASQRLDPRRNPRLIAAQTGVPVCARRPSLSATPLGSASR